MSDESHPKLRSMLKLCLSLAALLAVSPAAADDTLSLQLAGTCSDKPTSFRAGGGAAANCGPAAGARWIHGRGDLWKLGFDWSAVSLGEPGRPLNRRGGDLHLVQAVIQHDFSSGFSRPYAQVGAGVFGSQRHSGEHPLDLAASGTLGVEFGERFLLGMELRTTYLMLDESRFPRQSLLVYTPALRVGWRFR